MPEGGKNAVRMLEWGEYISPMRRAKPILRSQLQTGLFGRVLLLSCAIVVLSFLFPARQEASAEQATVTVKATVAGISPGETLVVTNAGAVPLFLASPAPSSPGGIPPPASPRAPSVVVPSEVGSVLTPTSTIEPATGQEVGSRLAKDANGTDRSIPVFFSNRPKFSGKTNIPNAEVTFEIEAGDIRIRGKTYTADDGSYSWPAPAFDLPGLYTIIITVTDPTIPSLRVTESLDFYLDFEALSKAPAPRSRLRSAEDSAVVDPLFDVLVAVTQKYKRVLPGEEVIVGVKLLNFGFAGKAVDVPVEYLVEDERGRTVSASSETVAVSTQISLLKTFNTAPNTDPGEYTVIVQVPSRGMRALSSDTFQVVSDPEALLRGSARSGSDGGGGPAGTPLIPPNVLLAGFAFFGLFAYSGYNKVTTLQLMGRLPPKVSEKELRHYINRSI